MPRAFPREFRDDVVAIARRRETSFAQIARDFGIVASVPNANWTVAAVSRVYSDPFGAVRGATDGGVPGDHRFLGATRDQASGLTLLGARYSDASSGRFLSVDPILNVSVNRPRYHAVAFRVWGERIDHYPSARIPANVGSCWLAHSRCLAARSSSTTVESYFHALRS